jgi:hypothetical protein
MPSITINFSAEHASRISAALTETLSLTDAEGAPLAATVEDLKTYIIKDIRQLVRNSELRVAERAAREQATNIDIT